MVNKLESVYFKPVYGMTVVVQLLCKFVAIQLLKFAKKLKERLLIVSNTSQTV